MTDNIMKRREVERHNREYEAKKQRARDKVKEPKKPLNKRLSTMIAVAAAAGYSVALINNK